MGDAAVLISGFLTEAEASAIEAAVGPAVDGWRPCFAAIEREIRARYGELAAPFPVVRRHIGDRLAVRYSHVSRDAVTRWHVDRQHPGGGADSLKLVASYYVGEFTGGEVEVAATAPGEADTCQHPAVERADQAPKDRPFGGTSLILRDGAPEPAVTRTYPVRHNCLWAHYGSRAVDPGPAEPEPDAGWRKEPCRFVEDLVGKRPWAS